MVACGRTIATWTVNSEDYMWKSMDVGAQFGISETPLRYKKIVKYVLRRCENKKLGRHASQFIQFVA